MKETRVTNELYIKQFSKLVNVALKLIKIGIWSEVFMIELLIKITNPIILKGM